MCSFKRRARVCTAPIPARPWRPPWPGMWFRRKPWRSTSSTRHAIRHGFGPRAAEACAATAGWACSHGRARSPSSCGSASTPRSKPCAQRCERMVSPTDSSSHASISGRPRALGPSAWSGQRLGYRRIVQLLVYLVIVPTVLILLVGIVLMFLGNVFNALFGVLTVSFVLVVVTGVTLVLVFLRRE